MRRLSWWGILVGWWLAALAGAGAADVPKGFTISPAYQMVNVPATGDADFSIGLTNHTSKDQNFRLSAQDFGSLDDTGGVAFLGAPASELEHKYGLASWLVLGKDALFVPAGASVQVPVSVENRQSLAPGGHYGAVLVTAVDDFGQPIQDPRVGLKQVLTSLVLAVKEGGLVRQLRMTGQDTDAGWGRLPKEVQQHFANDGNVHLVPRGVTEVKDAFGWTVERGALNEASAVILPESYRRYKTPLTAINKALWPGRYRVVTTYRYDGTDQTKVFATTFWYAGALVVWALGILVLAAAAGLVWWLWFRPRRKRRKK